MRKLGRVLCLALAMLVAGCVSFTPTVGEGAPPEPGSAYLFGRFSLRTLPNPDSVLHLRIGLLVQEANTHETISIEFERGGRAAAVAVKPGTWRVIGASFAFADYERQSERHFPDGSPMLKPFRVEAGHAYYLADFLGTVTLGQVRRWNVGEIHDNYADTRADFARRYPRLQDLPQARALGGDVDASHAI